MIKFCIIILFFSQSNTCSTFNYNTTFLSIKFFRHFFVYKLFQIYIPNKIGVPS